MVYISGAGIIAALGVGKKAVLQSLVAARSGIGPISVLSTHYKGRLPVGEINNTNADLILLAGLSHYKKPVSRTSLLGLIAAREALEGIEIDKSIKTGFISANSVGGMDNTEQLFETFMNKPTEADVSNAVTHDCGDSTGFIAGELGISDFITTISTACSSSANSIMLGARMIKAGLLDRVVAGGADALTKFTLNGFNALQILDNEPCKPFDENRKGLNLGEGAGYIVMESEALAARHPNRIIGALTGYANTNDAYHQTASSPTGTGALMAMQKALKIADLNPEAISYINAHGTGTENNDLSEGIALKQLFTAGLPPFSSTKAFTGHTLGAAGGIEAVISLLAIQNQTVFANLNFQTPIQNLMFKPETSTKSHSIGHVLSNSFGFGGNCTSLVFSKVDQWPI